MLRHLSWCWECCVWDLLGDKGCGMKDFSISLLGLCLFCLKYPAPVLLKTITALRAVCCVTLTVTQGSLWVRGVAQGESQLQDLLRAELC